MSDLVAIFKFGWPYMRRYWFRLLAGVLLGILFGVSNATFVWGTKTLFDRLDPPVYDAQGHFVMNVVQGKTNSWAKGPNDIELLNGEEVIREPIALFVAQTNTVVITGKAREAMTAKVKQAKKKPSSVKLAFERGLDPWLPLKSRAADWRQILGGFCLLPILVALRGYIGYLSAYCMRWVSERVVRDLRLDVLQKINSLSVDFFTKTTIGELLSRISGDTTALYRCLSLGISDLVTQPVTVVGMVVALFMVNWKLTLMAVVFTPVTVIPIRILGKKVRKNLKSGIRSGMLQDSLLVEVYSSIRVVKAFCLEEMQMRRFREIYAHILRLGMKGMQAKELVNPTVETISMLGLGIVIIYIFTANVTASDLVAFLLGVTVMYTPIKKLGSLHVLFQEASVGAGRLIELFKFEPTVKEKPDALAVATFQRELRFENVSFGYTGKPVLRCLNLSVPRGQKLGIAGESGSGKSTLVNLVLRFYDPTGGRITIDGKDLRDVRVFDLRQQMAFVSQEIVIFDQTVAENIGCGRSGATRAEIEAAARAAFAHDFIIKLPQGYDTRVGERGQTLSQGQRQRLCIARAFVRNAPILVLDEATASLDAKAEGEVQAAIDRLTENRTVICIAHRLSTLASMDRVIVLSSEGVIVEDGKFEELLRAKRLFAAMAAKQGIVLS